jgi:hypothetical protein
MRRERIIMDTPQERAIIQNFTDRCITPLRWSHQTTTRAKDAAIQRGEDDFPFTFSNLSELRAAIDVWLMNAHQEGKRNASTWPETERRLRRIRGFLDRRLNRSALREEDRETLADMRNLLDTHGRAADADAWFPGKSPTSQPGSDLYGLELQAAISRGDVR